MKRLLAGVTLTTSLTLAATQCGLTLNRPTVGNSAKLVTLSGSAETAVGDAQTVSVVICTTNSVSAPRP